MRLFFHKVRHINGHHQEYQSSMYEMGHTVYESAWADIFCNSTYRFMEEFYKLRIWAVVVMLHISTTYYNCYKTYAL